MMIRVYHVVLEAGCFSIRGSTSKGFKVEGLEELSLGFRLLISNGTRGPEKKKKKLDSQNKSPSTFQLKNARNSTPKP